MERADRKARGYVLETGYRTPGPETLKLQVEFKLSSLHLSECEAARKMHGRRQPAKQNRGPSWDLGFLKVASCKR